MADIDLSELGDFTLEFQRKVLNGDIKGVVAVVDHGNDETSIIRSGTAVTAPKLYQADLVKLMINNTVYPDEYYIVATQK